MKEILEIKARAKEYCSGNFNPEICPKCGKHPVKFKRHEIRSRKWWIVINFYVHIINSQISRWICPKCKGRFTLWPDFALPNRRYIRKEVQNRSEDYVEDKTETYWEATCVDKAPIEHKDEKYHVMACSTVWRWLKWWGGQDEMLRRGTDLLLKVLPSSKIHRFHSTISAKKYRSIERKSLLETARCIFKMLKEMPKIINTINSPAAQ